MEHTKEHPMTATTMTLVEFLRARLDEDEAVARAATQGPWTVVHQRDTYHDGSFHEAWGVRSADEADIVEIAHDRDYGFPEPACDREENAAHIARHDPARVLAEVEAKRRILANALNLIASFGDHDATQAEAAGGRRMWDSVNRRERSQAWSTIEELASVYAGHPDYRDEWRP